MHISCALPELSPGFLMRNLRSGQVVKSGGLAGIDFARLHHCLTVPYNKPELEGNSL